MKKRIEELRFERNKLLQDAQAILLSKEIDSEKRASAHRMITDAGVLESDITALDNLERDESERRSASRGAGQPGAGESQEETPEIRSAKQKKAFEQQVRFGRTTEALRGYLVGGAFGGSASDLDPELRVLDTTVSAVIPQAFYPVLTESIKDWGAIIPEVTTRRTDNGAPMKIAMVDDTTNGLSELAESTAPTETDPNFTSSTLSSVIVTTGIIKITLAELQDSYWSLDGFITDKMGSRYARGLSGMITKGSVSGVVASLVAGAHTAVTSASPTAIAYGELTALWSSLDPGYQPGAKWAMNNVTRGLLLGVTDTLGRPIYIPNPNTGAFDMLLGQPVVINQQLDNVAASKVAIQYGAFKNYMLRMVTPLSVIRLNERFMDTLQVGFIGFARVAGVLLDPGSHPVQNLLQHA